MEWGYGHSKCPPENWVQGFPIAAGKTQSPIDVQTGLWIKIMERLTTGFLRTGHF